MIDLGFVCKFGEMKVFFRSKDTSVCASQLRLEKAKSPDGPWTVIKHGQKTTYSEIFHTNMTDNWQHFKNFEAYSQYLRLVLVKNHGHPHFVMISQVRIS